MRKVVIIWALILLILPSPASADGLLHLYFYYLKQKTEVRTDDSEKISQLFRSRDSNQVHPIDSKLIALIDQIEDHFGVRQVEIISGFRSQSFNQELKETGHHVANESFHTKGMAADIHLDEITEEAVRDYALSLKQGGVGYYPSLNMVHVDVGPVRTWNEDAPRKEWVGEKNEAVSLRMTIKPDRLLSSDMSGLKLTLQNRDQPMRMQIEPEVALEFFEGGQWKETGQLSLQGFGCSVSASDPVGMITVSLKNPENFSGELPYGKFRLKAKACLDGRPSQYSNEFYLKKK